VPENLQQQAKNDAIELANKKKKKQEDERLKAEELKK